jgi:hypothetical protein
MSLARSFQLLPDRLMHRLLVAMLVACSFACCCQQRTLGALFASEVSTPTAAGCCGGCCAGAGVSDGPAEDPSRESPSQRERHPVGRCDNACCTKAEFKTPQFTVGCDEIGAPIKCTLVVRDAPTGDRPNEAVRLEDDVGEPPPWLLLLVSARLRI